MKEKFGGFIQKYSNEITTILLGILVPYTLGVGIEELGKMFNLLDNLPPQGQAMMTFDGIQQYCKNLHSFPINPGNCVDTIVKMSPKLDGQLLDTTKHVFTSILGTRPILTKFDGYAHLNLPTEKQLMLNMIGNFFQLTTAMASDILIGFGYGYSKRK